MAAATKTKSLPAAGKTAKKDKGKQKERLVAQAEIVQVVAEEDSEEEEDSDNGGVTEEGMQRLMQALGDEPLDEFDNAQLESLIGDEDEDEDDSEGEEALDNSDAEFEENDDDDDEVEEAGSEVELDADETEEEDIALDDVESIDDDAVPKQKIEIDNEVALERIRETIRLDPSISWTETLAMSYPHTIDVDVEDDLNRELAFYKQALHSADAARTLAAKHKFPFARPADYFAEMVKSDSHMERIRQRLLDEKAGMKKGEDKRREREGKKFGKQVQVEKLKERSQSKREMEERLNGLKRKRKDVLDTGKGGGEDDGFDIAVEDAIADRPSKRGRGSAPGKISREGRDSKFGFGGGAGRRSKSNTKASTDDFDSGPRKGTFRGGRTGGSGARGGRGRGGSVGGRGRGGASSRGGSKRLGKSRREASRGRS